jgi:hypothetical protein
MLIQNNVLAGTGLISQPLISLPEKLTSYLGQKINNFGPEILPGFVNQKVSLKPV